jgi:alkanesulfonate monooxygenase SsuD/methylene tetrahydromethanopterin reductase-like flavin-dependent oxidoreductase (luciferase family)
MTNLMAHHVRTLWERVEEGAASTGRDADRHQLRIGREVSVGETPESARAEARMVLGRPFDEHQYVHRKAQGNLRYVKRDPAMPDEAVDVDSMMEHVWIVGDPQECADKIRQLHAEVGGFGHLLAITQDPDDHALMQRSLRLLMEEVAPRVQDLA